MDGEALSGDNGRGLHRLAVLTAVATLVLVFVGGLVTSTGSGLAVPDWPLAFGRLVPEWRGGVRFEFGHRVVAGVVVVLTLLLTLWAVREEPRRWVRRTVLAALALVMLQAVLGGVTVLLELPLSVAVAHAATAQAFFCLTVAVAMFTNPSWEQEPRLAERHGRLPLAALAAITTAIIYGQMLVGALMRHLGAGLAIPDFPLSFGHLIPPHFNQYIAVNFAHRLGALAVAVVVVWTTVRVLRSYPGQPRLRRAALGLFLLLAIQLCLGAVTVWSGKAVIPTTAHVAVGAALLASSFALALRCYHIVGLPGAASEAGEVGSLSGRGSAIGHPVSG